MKKSIVVIGIALVIVAFLYGCISFGDPKDKEEEFAFVAMEAPGDTPKDEPKQVPAAKAQEEKKTTLYAARINEIDEKNKTVVLGSGSSNGLKRGMKGKIFNDAAKTQEIGTISLTQMYPNFCEGSVVVSAKINRKEAVAVFEIEE